MTGTTDPGDTTDVVVLGAGVSGLAAAAQLSQAGCSVLLLDARDRVGGRVFSRRGDTWPVPMDLGAEFIQGRIGTLFTLAHQLGLPVVELSGARWMSRGGQVVRADELQSQLGEILAHLPDLGPQSDQSLEQFLTTHVTGESAANARALARSWIESYDAADPERVSVRFLLRERRAEHQIESNRVFRLVTGYDGIPQALLAGIAPDHGRLHLETVATEVQWTPGAVRVAARGPLGESRGPFMARRLVVALPLGVLQAQPPEPGAVRFTPLLGQKQTAVSGLEMGHVVKLVLAFKERFWERTLPGELGFLMVSDGPFQGFWTGYPVVAPVLVAWAGGPVADRLAGLTIPQRVDRALDSLARVVRLPRAALDQQLVAWDAHDWAADPFARGAYSYVRVGGIEAQAELARPVESTLFFAGEATELTGFQATVHGAISAGRRAADEVLQSLA